MTCGSDLFTGPATSGDVPRPVWESTNADGALLDLYYLYLAVTTGQQEGMQLYEQHYYAQGPYRLTPVPEPSSIVLFTTGTLLLL